jgi:4'-phosphopantetheinyl transferase
MKNSIGVFIADIKDSRLMEHCRIFYRKLSAAERRKADGFLHEDDRLGFVAGRLMINTIAAEQYGISAPEIRLTEYGKPYITAADALHFNISHSGDHVVLAMSDAPVGVDIEQRMPIEWQQISQTFGEKEREMLDKAGDPISCFYRIWTMREAFAKADGRGIPLFDEEQPDIDYERGIVAHCGKTWYLAAAEIGSYSVCVCGSSPGGLDSVQNFI